MEVFGLDHINIQCREADLPSMRRFWGEIIGLTEGRRPNFNFPGIWFWSGDRAVVHIAARLSESPSETSKPHPFGHVALRAHGLDAARNRLKSMGVPWREAPVPGFPLHQIFLHDRTGIMVELTFDTDSTAP